jgi:hypothetical protein
LLNQLRQSLDAVVVNGSLRLGGPPLQAAAFLTEHYRAKVLPACEAILPGEHKLGVSQRKRKGRNRHLGVDTRQSVGGAGGKLAD